MVAMARDLNTVPAIKSSLAVVASISNRVTSAKVQLVHVLATEVHVALTAERPLVALVADAVATENLSVATERHAVVQDATEVHAVIHVLATEVHAVAHVVAMEVHAVVHEAAHAAATAEEVASEVHVVVALAEEYSPATLPKKLLATKRTDTLHPGHQSLSKTQGGDLILYFAVTNNLL